MTQDQLQGAGDRALLVLVTWFLTFATSKGWLTTSDVAQLAPTVVTIIGFAWGYYVNSPRSILKSASALPEVKKIVSTDSAQVNDPSLAKVVGQ
jgi:hypothetical protein